MRKTALVLLTGIAFLMTACENEVELNAPYKELGVIYGLINAEDDTLSVRIQKTFLGEGNANDMAQITDSVRLTLSVPAVGQSVPTTVVTSYSLRTLP